MAFLLPRFVHVATPCLVQLITATGEWNNVSGIVGNCRYVRGRTHEITVRFSQAVAPSLYSAAAVRGRALLVEPDGLVSDLVRGWLTELSMGTVVCDSRVAAVEQLAEGPFDVILIESELPDGNGSTVASELRTAGFGGGLILISGSNSLELEQLALAAGFDRMLVKPFNKDLLSEALSAVQSEPLLSSLQADHSLAEMIAEFVMQLRKHMQTVRAVWAAEDRPQLLSFLRMLKSRAAAFGFRPIADAATPLESALAQGDNIAACRDEINALLRMCMRIRLQHEHSAAHSASSRKSAPTKLMANDDVVG